MLIKDGSKIKLRFASPAVLEYEAEGLTGEYLLGADTDCDLRTACCVTATAAAADGRLVFTPAMDNRTFYNKVQTGGETAGVWEIRSVADGRCIASGVVAFAAGVVTPGYTPVPENSVEFYNKAEADDLIASSAGITEPGIRGMVDQALDAALENILQGVNNV